MVSGNLERLAPDPASRYGFALVSVQVAREFNERVSPERVAENVAFMHKRAGEAGAGLSPVQTAQARRLASEVIARCRWDGAGPQ